MLHPADLETLAAQLQIASSTISYYAMRGAASYRRHEIRKKSGKIRVLHIPEPALATVQRRLLRRMLHGAPFGPEVAAYVPGRSLLTTVAAHARPAVLFTVDLQDFFGSTRRAWVRDALEATFRVPRDLAELLASLVTVPMQGARTWRVPQGAPTSGAVTNLVAGLRLDPQMRAVAHKHGLTYSRYADDLVLSRATRLPKAALSDVFEEVFAAVRQSGYRVNYDKVRVAGRGEAQRVLGLTVNAHPNVPRRDYRALRAIVHSCAAPGQLEALGRLQGYASAEAFREHLLGRIAWLAQTAPGRAARLRAQLGSV